jgi:hypothetical protein
VTSKLDAPSGCQALQGTTNSILTSDHILSSNVIFSAFFPACWQTFFAFSLFLLFGTKIDLFLQDKISQLPVRPVAPNKGIQDASKAQEIFDGS